jgi:hypothetical protein
MGLKNDRSKCNRCFLRKIETGRGVDSLEERGEGQGLKVHAQRVCEWPPTGLTNQLS